MKAMDRVIRRIKATFRGRWRIHLQDKERAYDLLLTIESERFIVLPYDPFHSISFMAVVSMGEEALDSDSRYGRPGPCFQEMDLYHDRIRLGGGIGRGGKR